MKDKGESRKVFKWFHSYQKELCYLEQMALEGWMLSNITMGVFYSFRKEKPRRMQYDIDRFNLPKKPTLEEIRHKELFLEMAREMGWEEVTHDESLNYYFAKEYVEGEINELHNDPASRRYRAQKFGTILRQGMRELLWAIALLSILCLVLRCLYAHNTLLLRFIEGFTLVYTAIFGCYCAFVQGYSVRVEKELSMSREEWRKDTDPAAHKKVYRLILTARVLNRFLKEQAKQNWILTEVTPFSYSFVKGSGKEKVYTMDTKRLVNKRRTLVGEEVLNDRKDWTGMNNDWELQSVNEAEQKGWSFVCALENRSIIYCGDPEKVQPLNDPKYDNSMRFISLIGEYGIWMLICGVAGGICGLLMDLMFG